MAGSPTGRAACPEPIRGEGCVRKGAPAGAMRGGSWNNTARNVRSSYRNNNHPDNRNDNNGFRCALSSSLPGGPGCPTLAMRGCCHDRRVSAHEDGRRPSPSRWWQLPPLGKDAIARALAAAETPPRARAPAAT